MLGSIVAWNCGHQLGHGQTMSFPMSNYPQDIQHGGFCSTWMQKHRSKGQRSRSILRKWACQSTLCWVEALAALVADGQSHPQGSEWLEMANLEAIWQCLQWCHCATTESLQAAACCSVWVLGVDTLPRLFPRWKHHRLDNSLYWLRAHSQICHPVHHVGFVTQILKEMPPILPGRLTTLEKISLCYNSRKANMGLPALWNTTVLQ